MHNSLSNEGRFYTTNAHESDFKKAFEVLNRDKHQKHVPELLKESLNNEFVLNKDTKTHLSDFIANPDTPRNLRQAAHLLLYHGAQTKVQTNHQKNDSSFSFNVD